jgi:predicted dehydrogenase
MEEREPVAIDDANIVTSAPASTPARGTVSRRLGVGVAGAGLIGAVHARSVRLAGATLAGVATSSPERSREAAERLGAEKAYATPEQPATADDVGHVCTPDPDLGGPSRAFADIGSHWCDLVEFMTGDRIEAICAQTSTVFAERAARGAARAFEVADRNGGRHRRVTTEDAVTAPFRIANGAHGTRIVSQVSPGRKNHLHVEIACADASVRFEQEQPETLWLGRRSGNETVYRDPTTLAPDAARLALAPAGHPQGYLDCFDLFVADSYAAIAGAAPEGLPLFADGARSARIVDAVLASAGTGGWVEV